MFQYFFGLNDGCDCRSHIPLPSLPPLPSSPHEKSLHLRLRVVCRLSLPRGSKVSILSSPPSSGELNAHPRPSFCLAGHLVRSQAAPGQARPWVFHVPRAVGVFLDPRECFDRVHLSGEGREPLRSIRFCDIFFFHHRRRRRRLHGCWNS